jgi:uncharacterized protein YgiM (DUF1202 family)
MRNTTKTLTGAALMAGVIALAGAGAASAGVTGCSAPGGKQEAGAVIGGVLGGLLGHSVGGRHATTETVAGVAAGAAAGSAVGCESQKSRTRAQSQRPATYARNGYRLSSDIAPASYSRMGQTFVANRATNLRSAPTSGSARVGSLRPGERFQALASVRGTDWILVGQGGIGVGYVRGDLVRPVGQRYAYGY